MNTTPTIYQEVINENEDESRSGEWERSLVPRNSKVRRVGKLTHIFSHFTSFRFFVILSLRGLWFSISGS